MKNKDCKTCSYGWRPKGTNAICCSHLYECKGGSPFKENDTEKLKALLKEAREVLIKYRDSRAFNNKIIGEISVHTDENPLTGHYSGAIHTGQIVAIEPTYQIQYNPRPAEQMIKKIDEVL